MKSLSKEKHSRKIEPKANAESFVRSLFLRTDTKGHHQQGDAKGMRKRNLIIVVTFLSLRKQFVCWFGNHIVWCPGNKEQDGSSQHGYRNRVGDCYIVLCDNGDNENTTKRPQVDGGI